MKIIAWERNLLLLALERMSRMPFQWAIGLEGSKFFKEIAEREVLVGIKCARCGKVYVPPRKVCGPCFVTMNEIVELGQEGVVEAVTLVNYPFIDPDTGNKRSIPYIYGYIKLDRADTLFSHIIKPNLDKNVEVGDRVRAVFKSAKQGTIQDISYFEPVP
jgi:uncharacterized OB-fold protein